MVFAAAITSAVARSLADRSALTRAMPAVGARRSAAAPARARINPRLQSMVAPDALSVLVTGTELVFCAVGAFSPTTSPKASASAANGAERVPTRRERAGVVEYFAAFATPTRWFRAASR